MVNLETHPMHKEQSFYASLGIQAPILRMIN